MTSCARVYWICHFNSWISYPRLCFIAFQMKFNYPVPSHFQFLGRDGSGTGIPSDPAGHQKYKLAWSSHQRTKVLSHAAPPPAGGRSSTWRRSPEFSVSRPCLSFSSSTISDRLSVAEGEICHFQKGQNTEKITTPLIRVSPLIQPFQEHCTG